MSVDAKPVTKTNPRGDEDNKTAADEVFDSLDFFLFVL